MKRASVILIVLFSAVHGRSACSAALVTVQATGANRNVEPLLQIVMSVDQGGGYFSDVVTGSRTTNADAESVLLNSITTTSGLFLNDFSTITPTVSNSNFPPSGSRIEIYTPRNRVNVADANFLDELANVHATGDLMQYLRVDGFNGTDPMWDLTYGGATFNSSNYLIVEERDGNTTFEVEPLDMNGNSIAGSDTLAFQDGSYEWDIGYQNALDPNTASQTQEISVLSFDLFNTVTPIGGFRITNTGNADFKFFVGTNAAVTGVPEPSSLVLILLCSTAGLNYRRKRRNVA